MPIEAGLARISAEAEDRDAFDLDRPLAPGALTPRGRIATLCDPGTFFEMAAMARSHHREAHGATPADGVITGFGRIGGREVALIVEDAKALAASDGAVGRNKRLKLLSHAIQGAVPIVYIADGAGPASFDVPGRLLGGYAETLVAGAELDLNGRRAPLITVVAGRCEGVDALLAAAADVVVATKHARGPVLADVAGDSDAGVLDTVRALLGLIPSAAAVELVPSAAAPPAGALADDLAPADLSLDALLEGLLDVGSVRFGACGSVVTGVGRVEGHAVVFAAGSGALSHAELGAVARAAHLSSRFALPFLAIAHGAAYPDFADGPQQLAALAAATSALHQSGSPKLALITRSGHTLGGFVLGGRELGFDYAAAWALADVGTADIPVYGVSVRDGEAGIGPWAAAGAGLLDDILAPSESRGRLGRVLDLMGPSRATPSAKGAEGGRLIYR
ncbi:MAG: carboxyl transferase domain-containing protein [Dehalococcoidia bacterium]